MNILNYCAGYDTGGYSIRLKRAFDVHSAHTYRSCIGRPVSYIRYPTDAKPREYAALARWADLIHVSHQPVPVNKPQVVQYHGTKFRNNPDRFLALQADAGAEAVCSTLDLWLVAPDRLTWLPSPYDLGHLARYRNPTGRLRVGHAPTARAIKSTDVFLAAAARVGVEVVLIERKPWETCLRLKGTCDVYFDQVILGYGNNAVEAWGMGLPVVAGAAPDTLAEMTARFGVLPFYPATEDTIADALAAMTDLETRETYAALGAAHARRWHDAEAVVRIAEQVYARATDTVASR